VPLLVRSSRALGTRALRGLPALTLLIGLAAPAFTQAPQTPASNVVITITFANGRVVTQQVGRRGETWVPTVPPLTGPLPSKAGQTLSGLGVTYQAEGQVVVATVFLTYGSPIASRVTVATLPVTAVPAVVNELRTYGVLPVTLSLAPLVGGSMRTPDVNSVSKALTVTVTPLPPGGSRYRVSIANTSSRTADAIRLDGYRGGAVVISSLQRGPHAEPAVGPGASATYILPGGGSAGGASGPLEPLERIAVTTVVWQDGFEGDSGMADDIRKFRVEERRALERVLPVLKQSAGQSVEELRSRLSALPTANDAGMGRIMRVLLADLTRAAGPLPLDSWLTSTIPIYEQWLARLSRPAR